ISVMAAATRVITRARTGSGKVGSGGVASGCGGADMLQVSHHLDRTGPAPTQTTVCPSTLRHMSHLGARLRGVVHAAAYPVYFRLPRRLRRWLVRRVTPTYTVGAVVLLRDETDRLLLLRQPPGTRGWSLPAGLLGRGESPIDGAVRELAEETGVRLDPAQLRPAVPNAVVHHRGRWVDMVFEARESGRASGRER